MPYRVGIKRSARKELAALPVGIRRRVDAALLALADEPRPPGTHKLAGSKDLWRIRVGDYRVVYTVRDELLLVLVVKVAHRREVYRG